MEEKCAEKVEANDEAEHLESISDEEKCEDKESEAEQSSFGITALLDHVKNSENGLTDGTTPLMNASDGTTPPGEAPPRKTLPDDQTQAEDDVKPVEAQDDGEDIALADDDRNIFVGGLAVQTDAPALKTYFSQFGEIVSAVIPAPPRGKN